MKMSLFEGIRNISTYETCLWISILEFPCPFVGSTKNQIQTLFWSHMINKPHYGYLGHWMTLSKGGHFMYDKRKAFYMGYYETSIHWMDRQNRSLSLSSERQTIQLRESHRSATGNPRNLLSRRVEFRKSIPHFGVSNVQWHFNDFVESLSLQTSS